MDNPLHTRKTAVLSHDVLQQHTSDPGKNMMETTPPNLRTSITTSIRTHQHELLAAPWTPSARALAVLWATFEGYTDAAWTSSAGREWEKVDAEPRLQVVVLTSNVLEGGRILLAGPSDVEGVHQTWYFRTMVEAQFGFRMWEQRQFAGEPQGWVKHLPSNRRRQVGRDGVFYREWVEA